MKQNACRIEHVIGDESFQKLKDAIKRNDKAR